MGRGVGYPCFLASSWASEGASHLSNASTLLDLPLTLECVNIPDGHITFGHWSSSLALHSWAVVVSVAVSVAVAVGLTVVAVAIAGSPAVFGLVSLPFLALLASRAHGFTVSVETGAEAGGSVACAEESFS